MLPSNSPVHEGLFSLHEQTMQEDFFDDYSDCGATESIDGSSSPSSVTSIASSFSSLASSLPSSELAIHGKEHPCLHMHLPEAPGVATTARHIASSSNAHIPLPFIPPYTSSDTPYLVPVQPPPSQLSVPASRNIHSPSGTGPLRTRKSKIVSQSQRGRYLNSTSLQQQHSPYARSPRSSPVISNMSLSDDEQSSSEDIPVSLDNYISPSHPLRQKKSNTKADLQSFKLGWIAAFAENNLHPYPRRLGYGADAWSYYGCGDRPIYPYSGGGCPSYTSQDIANSESAPSQHGRTNGGCMSYVACASAPARGCKEETCQEGISPIEMTTPGSLFDGDCEVFYDKPETGLPPIRFSKREDLNLRKWVHRNSWLSSMEKKRTIMA